MAGPHGNRSPKPCPPLETPQTPQRKPAPTCSKNLPSCSRTPRTHRTQRTPPTHRTKNRSLLWWICRSHRTPPTHHTPPRKKHMDFPKNAGSGDHGMETTSLLNRIDMSPSLFSVGHQAHRGEEEAKKCQFNGPDRIEKACICGRNAASKH